MNGSPFRNQTVSGYVLVQVAEHDIQTLQFRKQLTLVGPNVQFLDQLRHDQERPPASDLLRFQDVTEDVVSYVQYVFPLRLDQIREHVTRAWSTKLFNWGLFIYNNKIELSRIRHAKQQCFKTLHWYGFLIFIVHQACLSWKMFCHTLNRLLQELITNSLSWFVNSVSVLPFKTVFNYLPKAIITISLFLIQITKTVPLSFVGL